MFHDLPQGQTQSEQIIVIPKPVCVQHDCEDCAAAYVSLALDGIRPNSLHEGIEQLRAQRDELLAAATALSRAWQPVGNWTLLAGLNAAIAKCGQ